MQAAVSSVNLRIESKAETLEKVHRLAEVTDGQIKEYLRSHFLVRCESDDKAKTN
jgi:hypothetical protein